MDYIYESSLLEDYSIAKKSLRKAIDENMISSKNVIRFRENNLKKKSITNTINNGINEKSQERQGCI